MHLPPPVLGPVVVVALAAIAPATDYIVAPVGGTHTSIQAALNAAFPGDRVLVRAKPGGWNEKLVFPRSGTATAPIVLMAFPGEQPILDGTGVAGPWMVTIVNRSHVQVLGLEIRNNLGVVNDGSGIRVAGAGAGVVLRNNVIHDMRGFGAMGITVYGTSVTASISGLVIDGNLIYACEPSDSEALTLNGNVEQFVVTNNVVRDVNNIGIDFIGGEASINPTFVARNGRCAGNVVLRARSNYGGGYAAGIYVDGGRDIVIEQNVVVGCDLGIEIGAENAGITATGIVVRSNFVAGNEKVGIVFGGYDVGVGRVENCSFVNNTCWRNDTLNTGNGELWLQWASNNLVANNVLVATGQNVLLSQTGQGSGNQIDRNAYWCPAGANACRFTFGGQSYTGFAAYRTGTGNDASSLAADPLLCAPAGQDGVLGTDDDDPRLRPGSPCIDRGSGSLVAGGGPRDLFGLLRLVDVPTVANATAQPIDLGACERGAGPAIGAEPQALSVAAGGTWRLRAELDPALTGQAYLFLLSVSGSAPGIVLAPGVVAPVALDGLTAFGLSAANSAVLPGFLGVVDGNGRAAARLILPNGLPLAGLAFTAAVATYDGAVFTSAAGPVLLQLAL